MSDPGDIEAALAQLLVALRRFSAAQRREFGLSLNEEAVLQSLASGVTAPGELSRIVGMTTAGMTNLVDRLESNGFLRREPHAADKRRVLLTLTKRGYRTQLEFDDLLTQLAREAHVALDAEGREALTTFLRSGLALVEDQAATVGTDA